MNFVVVHHDPIARGSFDLVAEVLDASGKMLDVPRVVDVAGFVLHASGWKAEHWLSYRDGSLSGSAGAALARLYRARIRMEPELQKWLIAETFLHLIAREAVPA